MGNAASELAKLLDCACLFWRFSFDSTAPRIMAGSQSLFKAQSSAFNVPHSHTRPGPPAPVPIVKSQIQNAAPIYLQFAICHLHFPIACAIRDTPFDSPLLPLT